MARQPGLCDTLRAGSPRPGWRNWQTQRTQNPPALAVMGVRPPSRHHTLNKTKISTCRLAYFTVPKNVPRVCPSSPHRHQYLRACSMVRNRLHPILWHNKTRLLRLRFSNDPCPNCIDANESSHQAQDRQVMGARSTECHLCDLVKKTLTDCPRLADFAWHEAQHR